MNLMCQKCGNHVKETISEDTMEKLGVYEGCTVEVGLSNDVTPKVYRVI